MQKALTQMNLKLQHVVSDITGVTGMRIIEAILAGQRDPHELAKLRDRRCKRDEATIAQALFGSWREEHLFALRQAVDLYRFYHQKIVECDQQIQSRLTRFEDRSGGRTLPCQPRQRGRGRNEPGIDLRASLFRLTGVDLTTIDGIDGPTALKVLSEVGTDMTRWPTAKHFCSWLGLCPGSRKSGGKMLSSRTKPCANRAALALRLAAHALHRSRTALGAFLRRMKGRLGGPKAITATAHKLARLIYTLLKSGQTYVDQGQDYYEQQYQQRAEDPLPPRHRARHTLIPLDVLPPDPQPA